MLELIRYTDSYRVAWDDFVAANEGTVFHLTAWKKALEDTFGYEALYYMAVERNQIRGILPIMAGRDLLLRKTAASLPFVNHLEMLGDCTETREFLFASMEQICRAHGLNHVQVRLKEWMPAGMTSSWDGSNYTLVIPLEGGEEKVLSLSTGSNRNHVRKVYKNDHFQVSYDKNNLDGFYRIYCKTMKRLGSPAPAKAFYKNILEAMPRHTELMTVADKATGAILGGMFLFIYADTVYYQWGGSLSEYNKMYINNFMYWEAVKLGILRGSKWLDLGRSPFEGGTYKFKLQWGAVPIGLKYCQVGGKSGGVELNKENLGGFIKIWKILPDFMTDTIGRVLIKHLMP